MIDKLLTRDERRIEERRFAIRRVCLPLRQTGFFVRGEHRPMVHGGWIRGGNRARRDCRRLSLDCGLEPQRGRPERRTNPLDAFAVIRGVRSVVER